jgi:hypothetical protein
VEVSVLSLLVGEGGGDSVDWPTDSWGVAEGDVRQHVQQGIKQSIILKELKGRRQDFERKKL